MSGTILAVKPELLIPIVGAAIAVATFLIRLNEWAGNFTTRRRVAARIKQIAEVSQHSEKDSAKRVLQNQLDELVQDLLML